ncbi:MAG: hypothetical protein M3P85_16850 [Actinomycetota bacterium]|nr:hypothetical protein [Actinomycetota bacterium]
MLDRGERGRELLPARRVTVVAPSDDVDAIQAAALALAHSPVRAVSLDVSWKRGGGAAVARYAGGAAREQARAASRTVQEAGLPARLEEDDEVVWARQRAAQRSPDGVLLKVSSLPAELSRVLRVAERARVSAVARAGLGLSWLALEPRPVADLVAAVEEVRAALAPRPVVVLDGPRQVRESLDVWGERHDGSAATTSTSSTS